VYVQTAHSTAVYHFCSSTQLLFTISVLVPGKPANVYNLCATKRLLYKTLPLFILSVLVSDFALDLACVYNSCATSTLSISDTASTFGFCASIRLI
jgi:hypothetical protein